MKIKPVYIFCLLSFLFLIYSFSIYLSPMDDNKSQGFNFNKEKALKGQLIWQRNNCQSCHQLYGLGGYLGPDLTNVCSDSLKGEVLVRAMLKIGVKQMPAFNMQEEDIQNLLEFLKSVDASGKSDPRNYITTNTGMIERK